MANKSAGNFNDAARANGMAVKKKNTEERRKLAAKYGRKVSDFMPMYITTTMRDLAIPVSEVWSGLLEKAEPLPGAESFSLDALNHIGGEPSPGRYFASAAKGKKKETTNPNEPIVIRMLSIIERQGMPDAVVMRLMGMIERLV